MPSPSVGEESLVTGHSTIYRLGEFVFDTSSGELRRNGYIVRLQPQPLQILLALLRRPGEVVTRDDIRGSLWPDDTYVAFDDGLNHAIRRLRDALGDTAQVPRYIETVPRRGYRLIASVEPDTPPAPQEIPSSEPLYKTSNRRSWFLIAALVYLLLAAVAIIFFVRPTPAPSIHSVAVLPFADFSGTADQEYFADGITEELTTELARIRSLRVISRTSSMRLKGKQLSLGEIGRELGVDAVVEGSVQRSGDRVRISAQLVHVATERHIWAETYERELNDVLRVRSEVAREIAVHVRHEVNPGESAGLRENTISPAAYEAYLVGARLANRGDTDSFERSIPYFEQAIRLEPDFALAYAELAESHGMLAFISGERGDHLSHARQAAAKAFELDPTLPEAQIGTADYAFYFEWDWSQCDGPFRKTAERYPNSAQVQYHYGLCLSVLGRYDDAWRFLENARRVDPLSPMITRAIGRLLIVTGHNQEAVLDLLRARDLEPDNPDTYNLLSLAYRRTGQDAESVAAYVTLLRLAREPEQDIATLAQAYRSGGLQRFDQQRLKLLNAKLDRLLSKSHAGTVRPFTLAQLCAATGRLDQAFQFLYKTYDERNPNLAWLKSSLAWEPLHNDRRYGELLRRMGLPE